MRNEKARFRDNPLQFQIFEDFENLEIDFSTNLNKYF